MKLNRYIFVKIAAFIVSAIVIVNYMILPEEAPKAENNSDRMRGIWVSLIYNMDYPKTASSDPAALKAYADEVITDCADMGINNIFLQVRAVADSIYPSKIYPYSKYLTGKQGTAPSGGFDPLAYWVETAHKSGIKLHAWINPYRITTGGDAEFAAIAPSNPAAVHPDFVVKSPDGNYYFDPGIPEVRNMVVTGALEIAENYDVDGIHMDDYFYPSKGIDDSASYAAYGAGSEIESWRRNNVTTLVRELNTSLKSAKPDIIFGISPSGIWANKKSNPLGSNTNGLESYYSLYADTRQWALDEIIDYIAPQIYWNIGYEIADYKTLVNWWADTLKNSDTKLYIGIADYKTVQEESGIWHNDGVGEISRQLALNDTTAKVGGEIHFRYGSVKTTSGLYDLLKSHYNAYTIPVLEKDNNRNKVDTAYINKSLKMTVNDNFFFPKESDGTPLYPITYNDSTYLPARALAECLGAEVDWDSQSNTVIIKSGGEMKMENATGIYPDTLEEISVTLNGIRVQVDGKQIVCKDAKGRTVSPLIYNDRTYIPVRAAASALGAKVDYNEKSKTVVIVKK